MATYLSNGEIFVPSKKELLSLLLFLKGAFSPSSFLLFEHDYKKRTTLSTLMEKPYFYMDLLAESKNHPGFDFEKAIDTLSFSACAQHLMFCLRLITRQGGNELLCTMWKNGSIVKLIDRMLAQFDDCTII